MTLSLPDVWSDLAVELHRHGKLPAALATCRRASGMDPTRSDIMSNLGNMLRCNGKMDEALAAITRALELNPKNSPAKFNMGAWHLDRQDPEMAIRMFDEALKKPGKHEGDWNFARACALLMNHQWLDGFAAYDRHNGRPQANIGMPLWQGDHLERRRLLVHGEQGFGDIIMFARFLKYIPVRVLFAVPAPLVRLFGALELGEEIEADCHVPLMSLPHLLQRNSVDTPPYLASKRKLGVRKPPGAKLNVGLVWKAKTSEREMTPEKLQHGNEKSMPFENMLDLMAIPAVALYSLQTGTNDIERTNSYNIVEDLSNRIMDFADLASFIAQMDVVVSVDTAPAHLAGAMGKPVVLCLHHAGSWQWGTGSDTPWYDSVQIVRQEKPGVWPMENIVKAVAAYVG